MTKSGGALEQALRVLRRHKLVVLVALVCVPAVAFVYSSSQQKMYTATATLLFESGEEGTFEASREAATNEALAELPAVAVRAAKALNDGTAAGEILGSVTASSANEMANLTKIQVTTDSPERSALIANAYSHAYVDFRREADQSQVTKAIELIEKSLEELPPEKASGIQGEALREQLNQLEVERALRTGRTELVQPAGVPTEPSSPKTSRNVAIAIVAGAILGLLLAVLLERIDRRVRTVEELEELFDLPLVARIPRSRAFADSRISDMLQAPEAETFRALRTNLHYFKVDRDLRSVLIASPEPSDGKSTVAQGLAGAMAEIGDNVILVEADLRKESSFERPGTRLDGLSDVLTGAPLESALMNVGVSTPYADEPRSLTVLPCGPTPPNPPELLESAAMSDLMAKLQNLFDLVVVDTPALGILSDALIIAPLVSEILAVGAIGKTTREGIRDFTQHLSLVGKKPIGLVITLTDFDRSQYAYYRRSSLALNS